MLNYKPELEAKFGTPLLWERLETKKASRIKSEKAYHDFPSFTGSFRDEENWDAFFDWVAFEMKLFFESAYPIWEKVQSEIS